MPVLACPALAGAGPPVSARALADWAAPVAGVTGLAASARAAVPARVAGFARAQDGLPDAVLPGAGSPAENPQEEGPGGEHQSSPREQTTEPGLCQTLFLRVPYDPFLFQG